MHASVRRYGVVEAGASSIDELMRLVQEGFVPIISSTPGFIAYYVVDAGDGDVASISIFEDEAGAEESNRRAASWVQENLAQYLQGIPDITAGEVTVSHTR